VPSQQSAPFEGKKDMITHPANSGNSTHTPKIFVICNQTDTAPVWGYILRKDGLIVVLEKSVDNALEHWSKEIPDLTVIDMDDPHQKPVELCQMIRTVSVAPILLLLPRYDEVQVLEAYQAGVDDVVVKPVSPAVFLAKIRAWVNRSWTVPVESLSLVNAGRYRLDPTRRCLVDSDSMEIKLTNLEFRLLHLLMSQPAHVFETENIIESIWGMFGNGDQALLKNVVYRLRKKIEADPAHPMLLQTGIGGYSFHG
jgi:DNA-binding response OmpR family regulator